MRKLVILAIWVVGLAALGGEAQEVPGEVKAFLGSYVRDSTAKWGPLEYKKAGAIPESVQIKDLSFRVLQVYSFKGVSLNEYPDTVALGDIIEPSASWHVLVIAHNKALYELTLYNKDGVPRIIRTASGSGFRGSRWDPLLKVYPESAGMNPVLVTSRAGFGRTHDFLYFKKKGHRKIYFLKPAWDDDPLDSLLTASIETLDDSKKLIGYWKKRGINKIGFSANETMKLEKTKDTRKDESTEQKGFSSQPIYMRGSLRAGDSSALFPVRGGEKWCHQQNCI